MNMIKKERTGGNFFIVVLNWADENCLLKLPQSNISKTARPVLAGFWFTIKPPRYVSKMLSSMAFLWQKKTYRLLVLEIEARLTFH